MENALELLERVTARFPPPPSTRHSLTMDEGRQLVLGVMRERDGKNVCVHLTLEGRDLRLKPYELIEEIELALEGT